MLSVRIRKSGTRSAAGWVQTRDLRNLGNERTLVIVNGRGLANFPDAIGDGGVDVGMILEALSRESTSSAMARARPPAVMRSKG